jgi:hypothetical protein
MRGGLPNPYRQSSRPGAAGSARVDLEQAVVHGVLAFVGAIGVVVGFAFARPIELAVGGILCAAAGRELWRDVTRHRRHGRSA